MSVSINECKHIFLSFKEPIRKNGSKQTFMAYPNIPHLFKTNQSLIHFISLLKKS